MRNGSRAEFGPKRVMLVDDHAMVRKGVRALIETTPGWEVCAEAEDGDQALAMASSSRPDIVVMDVSMPGTGGIDATIQIRKALPSVEILIFTMHQSEQLVRKALHAGAQGHLLKSESGDKLMDALTALSRHQPYISSGVGSPQGDEDHDTRQIPHRDRLTARERQIVTLVAEGNRNVAVANILGISIKTVQTHRLAAMQKVGAKSSADLALYAARNDMLQL
jgi:DNA-binding NarL/FixJ family response regulator